MLMYVSDETIEKFLKEDIPYIDLTTLMLDIGDEKGKISFTARGDITLACVEEVIRLFEKLQIKTVYHLSSGAQVKNGETFLIAEGLASSLHMAWKISLNILEYCCGIATRTKTLVTKAKKINPQISILVTRKSFPGTKELSIKSILSAGAIPHRLGLSESLLIFKQHTNFFKNREHFLKKLNQLRDLACEKKIFVEVENEEDALLLAKQNIDGLQFDKMPSEALATLVAKIRKDYPRLVLIGAGGINENNVQEYAATGINGIATTSIFFGKPADIKVTIDKI